MKIEAYKINGEIYVGSDLRFKKAEVSFYLPLRQIQSLINKSDTCLLHIDKDIVEMPTNAGMQKCKLVTYKNYPYWVQQWMDQIGMDFTEAPQFGTRIIHAPYKIGCFEGRGYNRIDFHNAFFFVKRNIKSGKWEKSLFFSKNRKRTIEKTMYGYVQPAY